MFKLILSLICFAALAHAQCPTGSTNIYGEESTHYCYKYLGETSSYSDAVAQCAAFDLKLVTPKTDDGLDDLYKLYRIINPNEFNGASPFWIGASASSSSPKKLFFQDKTPLSDNHYCPGEPKGQINRCGFYTEIIEDRCISTSPCNVIFDYAIICQTTDLTVNLLNGTDGMWLK